MMQPARPQGLLRPHSTVVWLVQRLLDAGIIAGTYSAVAARMSIDWQSRQLWLLAAAIVSYHLLAEINGVYGSWRTARLRDEVAQSVWSWVLSVPLLAVLVYLTFDTSDHKPMMGLVLWFLACPFGLAAFRTIGRLVLREARARGRNARRVGVAGATPAAFRLMTELKVRPEYGLLPTGVYDDRSPARVRKVLGEYELLGDLDQAVADAKEGLLDVLYITLPFKAQDRIGDIVHRLSDTTATVYLVADFSAFHLLHARFGQVAGLPTVSIFDTPFDGFSGCLKRVEDLILGTIITLLITPLLLVVAAMIRLDSKGPVFFSQTRCGLNGRPIRVFKFRTMKVAEDGTAVTQATRNDARVTRVGAFLRHTSLDELPQFFNVILGDMSIVGPRPHAVAHNEHYRGRVHRYMLRHKVKPGITGWAQVNGWRGETETVDKMEKRVEFDLQYIENWSLSWDLEIILKTALTLAGSKNAY